MKLDIEGCEYQALRSDGPWIRDNKPVLWAECNEAESATQILSFMLWAEMTVYCFAYPSFRRANHKGSKERIFPIAYEAGLLGLAPGGTATLDEEMCQEECVLRRIDSQDDLRRCLWLTPRWGTQEWANLSRPELIALLGREKNNESMGTFLR